MKNYHAFNVLSLLVSCAVSIVWAYNAPTLYPDPALSGIGIEKSMAKLAGGKALKIVYFGQSITSNTGVVNWWPDTVTNYLKAKYPLASITAYNAAISGCDAKCMTDGDNITSKLVPQNPDLIVLYIYFHLENEMEAMIKQIVSKLPNTEVVIFDFHYSLPLSNWVATGGSKSEVPWEDALSYDYLPWLCEKYSLGYLDIRTPWVKYLEDYNNKVDNGLLTNKSDGIHLTPQGNWIMAEFVKPYFIARPADTVSPAIDSISALGNKIWIRFGEKVDSVSATTNANFIVDGGSPSVASAVLNPDKRTVTIVTASPLSDGSHAIAVKNVKDRAGNVMATIQKNVTEAAAAGWNSIDIGRVYTPGSLTMDQTTGDFTLRAGGEHASPMNCAWGAMANPCFPYWMWRNEFRFAYKTLSGDFTLTAHVTNLDSAHMLSQAGIMVREDLQYLSKFTAINTFKQGGGYFDYVKRTGLLDTIAAVKPRSVKTALSWLRLARTGAVMEAFTSSNGTAWTSEGATQAPMTDQVFAGPFLCGNEYSKGPFRAIFSNVSITQPAAVSMGRNTAACRNVPRLSVKGKIVIIDGLEKGVSSDIVFFDIKGRMLREGRTDQASYRARVPQMGNGVFLAAIKHDGQSFLLRWNAINN